MDTGKLASTITQFCMDHMVSRSGYYNLRAQGLAPDEMHLGRKVLITNEAAAEWRLRMTELTANAKAEKESAVAEAARRFEESQRRSTEAKAESAPRYPQQKRRRQVVGQAKEPRE